MYAIVDIAGQQFKVEKKQKLYVHRLEGKEGSKVVFDNVLLLDDEGKVKVGTPKVSNTIVTAKIISHLKGDKVKVFKKKRRKGYQVLNGHRQYFTELLIEDIGEGKAPKAETVKVADKKAAPVKETAKTEKTEKPAAKTEVKKETQKPASSKTQAAKSTAAKKPAAKKTTAAKPAAKKTTAAKPAAKKTTTAKAAPKKTDKKEE